VTALPPESGFKVGMATEMEISAHCCAEGELSILVELFRRYCEEIAGERGAKVHLAKEAFFEPLEERMATMLGDGRQLAALGTIDDVPIAMALGHLEELGDSSLLAVLDVLYVDKAAREVGMGEKMLDFVVEWAKANGASVLDTIALPGMRQAKNFLEGSGFTARLLVMHRRLD